MKSLALMWAVVMLSSQVRAEELYIVPVYGYNLRGSSAIWFSGVLLNNPHGEAVEVEVAETYPAMEMTCVPCVTGRQWTLAPYESLLLPAIEGPNGIMQLGAFTLQSSRPIDVDSVVQGRSLSSQDGVPFAIEPIEIGRRWIPANVPAYLPRVAVLTDHFQFNLFLVNPNDTAITVEYSLENVGGSRPTKHVQIAPNSTVLHTVQNGCVGIPGCGAAGNGARGPYRLNLRGSGEFYASASVTAVMPRESGVATPLFIGPVFQGGMSARLVLRGPTM